MTSDASPAPQPTWTGAKPRLTQDGQVDHRDAVGSPQPLEMENPELTWRRQESRVEDQTATAMQPRLPDDVEKEVEYTQLWTTER
ncbi:hypothetical protein PF010_g23355 [Phytophthora fragariae]|uniref:Uncharacterized protein n=1 Tax=Phytophthora fragariae TaxID=53985 RepID=A0A6A3RGL4_9STRA|nr:hypothetical protein PF010_g23355 [Phytophthora fragariae]KAE9095838.1 hypothetical protein PF007_g17230 [Phytophthora fragariae]